MIRVLLFIILTAATVKAQYSISGTITNQSAEPLSFVTILVLKQADSAFVSGSATDEKGNFIISQITSGNYIIRASFIGYNDIHQQVTIASGDVNLGALILIENPEQLEEVSLSLTKPTIQRDIDKLVFNVENTSLSNGSTWDILRRTPSVIVQQNSITVKNQAATVYINDKKVNLSPSELQSLLESFSGTNIKSIEVITNPSAKYDADSGLIINIVTSKNITPGYKGNVSGTFEQAVFPKYRAGTGHYFKNERINLSVDYSFNKRKEHKNDLGEITFFEPDNSINSFWKTDFVRITQSETHNINTSLDVALSDKTAINLSSSILIEPNTAYSNSELAETFNPHMQLDSLFTTGSDLDLKKHNVALDLSVDHRFNEKGTRVSASMHYTNFDHSRYQNVNTNYFLPNGEFLRNNSFFTNANQEIDILFGQIDFETTALGLKLETGLKVSQIDSKSGVNFYDVINGSENQNETLSDLFSYEESVLAGYVNFSKDWEKWKLRLGFRGEQTDVEGNSISIGERNSNDYFEVLPNLSLNFTPNDDHGVTFSYKRSLDRPRYELLNPFSYFINENNFSTGNPDLQPAVTQRYAINYLVESKYSFELYYRTSENFIDVLSFQNNTNRFLRSVSVNMIDRSGYGFEFIYGTPIRPWWYFNNYFSIFHEENTFLAIESGNQNVTINSDGIFTQMYNGFSISKDRGLTADLTLTYLSGVVSGTYLMDSFSTISIGVRKSLWENKAVLSLTANDIFDTTNRKLQADFLNQRNSYFAQIETQYLQLGFVYNFGNFRMKDNTRHIRNEERSRID